jgi:DNA-binding transcriptional LysR family regulator
MNTEAVIRSSQARTRCRANTRMAPDARRPIRRIGYTSDDMVVMQALVAAELGVTTIPGLALRAHRTKGIVASQLGSVRHVYAATYGDPPDPPATAALLAALRRAADGGISANQRQRPAR